MPRDLIGMQGGRHPTSGAPRPFKNWPGQVVVVGGPWPGQFALPVGVPLRAFSLVAAGRAQSRRPCRCFGCPLRRAAVFPPRCPAAAGHRPEQLPGCWCWRGHLSRSAGRCGLPAGVVALGPLRPCQCPCAAARVPPSAAGSAPPPAKGGKAGGRRRAPPARLVEQRPPWPRFLSVVSCGGFPCGGFSPLPSPLRGERGSGIRLGAHDPGPGSGTQIILSNLAMPTAIKQNL